ncbi:MAG: hypothetical protein MI725_01225 [Pirellulales bacterium]|nr:hypothetical protein [Pirellulales bacterium]
MHAKSQQLLCKIDPTPGGYFVHVDSVDQAWSALYWHGEVLQIRAKISGAPPAELRIAGALKFALNVQLSGFEFYAKFGRGFLEQPREESDS